MSLKAVNPGAQFRMDIAIPAVDQGLHTAARCRDGTVLHSLRLSFPLPNDLRPRRGFVTHSNKRRIGLLPVRWRPERSPGSADYRLCCLRSAKLIPHYTADIEVPVRVNVDLQSEHAVDLVTLFARQFFECFGHRAGIVL